MDMIWRLASTILPYTSLFKKALTLQNRFQRNIVTLSYKVLGESLSDTDTTPFFIFHDLLGTKKHWESLGKAIVNITKRTVVVVDLRNHGDSPHVNSHKYDEMAEDVLHLFEKLLIDKVCLIGHSMGGSTSMCVALMAPLRIAGLLVLDISPISSPLALTKHYPKLVAAMKDVQFKHRKNVRKARKEARRQLKDIITDDCTMRTVLSNVNVRPDGTIGWLCNLNVLEKYSKYMAKFPQSLKGKVYDGPTLFLGGQLSEFLPPDDLTKIREYFPRAVIHYVTNAGHHLHLDDTKTFLEYVITFFRNLQ